MMTVLCLPPKWIIVIEYFTNISRLSRSVESYFKLLTRRFKLNVCCFHVFVFTTTEEWIGGGGIYGFWKLRWLMLEWVCWFGYRCDFWMGGIWWKFKMFKKLIKFFLRISIPHLIIFPKNSSKYFPKILQNISNWKGPTYSMFLPNP